MWSLALNRFLPTKDTESIKFLEAESALRQTKAI